jgi:hypothetical protein
VRLRESAVVRVRTAGALLLILALTTTAAAQGGRGGKGRHARGESGPAPAYYERAAAQAEQQGDALRAAGAWHAARWSRCGRAVSRRPSRLVGHHAVEGGRSGELRAGAGHRAVNRPMAGAAWRLNGSTGEEYNQTYCLEHRLEI